MSASVSMCFNLLEMYILERRYSCLMHATLLQIPGGTGLFREGSCSEVPLIASNAEPRDVMVHSHCAMDEEYYKDRLDLPGLFNVQLKVTSCLHN